ncbi:MAG: lipocalin-like domain-containing protein [Gemmatimonadaceae bacterium]
MRLIRRSGWPLVAAAAVVIMHASSPAQGPTTRRSALVGTWRVVRFCDDDEHGKLYDPYGAHPSGYFIYTATGEVSIQIMRAPSVPAFKAGDFSPTGAESRALLDSYMGYYGTYTVSSDSTVVHHVIGGTLPSYNGTDQQRVFRIRGDTLVLGGSRATWACRVLIRAR